MDKFSIINEIFLVNEIKKRKPEIDIRKRETPMCIAVANRIINRTNANNLMRYDEGKPAIPMNGKRLQKILYLCQLKWIADGHNGYLISDDFEAWAKGPVVDSIYNVFSVYQDGDMLPYRSNDIKPLTDEERCVVNSVVDSTIEFTTDQIIEFTHIPNGPWHQVYYNSNTMRPVIPKEMICKYISNSRNKKQFQRFIEEGILTL